MLKGSLFKGIVIAAVVLTALSYGGLLHAGTTDSASGSNSRIVLRPLPQGEWGFGVRRPAVGICGTGLPRNGLMRRLALLPVKVGAVEIAVLY